MPLISKPTVFVIDGDDSLRESLRSLVESAGLNVEAYASPQQFLECYRPDGSACLVLDVQLPEMSGIDLQETLVERGIAIPIIITGHGDVPTAVQAMKRGAADFIEKPFNPQALLDCIQQCLKRDAENRRNDALRDQIRARLSTLTPREREVMDLIVEGHTNGRIAERLGISPRTVEVHRANLMQKMKTRTAAELVKAVCAYRMAGSIGDTTERKRGEEARGRLSQAIEAAPVGIALFDSDDQLVFFNRRYRELMAVMADILRPGINFEEMVRTIVARRPVKDARGREEEFILERMKHHRNPVGPFDLRRENKWLQANETRLPDSSTFVIITDITEQKQADEALLESEARLRAVFDNTPVCLNLKDTEGRYLLLNKPYEEWLGRPAEEIIGKRACEIMENVTEVDILTAAESAVLVTGETYQQEISVPRPDGNVYHRILIKYPVKSADGSITAIGTVAIDITKRIRAETERDARARQQEAVAELGKVAVATGDVEMLMNEAVAVVARTLEVGLCKVQELLPGGEALVLKAGIGWKKGLIGTATMSADAGSQAGYALQVAEPVILEDFSSETRFRVSPLLRDHGVVSGMSVIIPGEDRPFGVLGAHSREPRRFSRDDSNFLQEIANLLGGAIRRTRVEEALRKNKLQIKIERDQAQSYLDVSPVMFAVLDGNGDIVHINQKGCQVLGYEEGEILNRNWFELFIPDEIREEIIGVFNKLMSGETASVEFHENPLVTKSGEKRNFSFHYTVIRDDESRISGILFSAEDISERQETERILRQSQKMEAVGQLTGGIAHDFNNMLGVVMGNLDLLRREVAGYPKAMEHVEAAHEGAERGADITRKLLSFSREEVGNTRLTNVNEFIEGMEDLIAKSLTPKITIELHLADDIWSVNIDPRDFEDAILNLSLNARDAMPDGGSLVIEAANKALDEHYVQRNPGSTAGEHVMVLVSDTGTGMTPDVVEKAFQPFFSTKDEGQGTGLGLSMVYGFVQRSGGHIKVYSEPGRGTTFRIYLPRALEGADGTEPANAEADGELPRGDETILVVDDEENLLNVAVSFLEDLGYRTLTAARGNQALEVLQEQKQIDLMFTDVVMPGGMDGYDLAIEALKSRPGLKVLLTSGFASKRGNIVNGDKSLFEKLSSNLLSKPYNQPELAAAVRRTLDEED